MLYGMIRVVENILFLFKLLMAVAVVDRGHINICSIKYKDSNKKVSDY